MANIVSRQHGMGSAEEKSRDLIKERLKFSAERNSGHLRLSRKFWRYYLTSSTQRGLWKREPDRDPGSGVEWRADIFVPAVFSIIETAIPRIVFSLFGTRPYVKVVGRERADADRSRAVESLLDYDFEQAKVVMEAIDFFKAFYIFGTAIARVDYLRDFYEIKHPPEYTVEIDVDEETGEIRDAREVRIPNVERVTRFDGPKLKNVDMFSFYPDPMFTTIPEMRYVAEREETTLPRLKEVNTTFKKAFGKPLYKNLDDVPIYNENKMDDFGEAEDFRQDTDEIMRFNRGLNSGRTPATLDDDAVVLYHYWENDRYMVMANGHTIIKDGENPYNDKRKPYLAAPCFPTLKEFYGQGLVAPIQYLQEELNTLRNIALDQGKLNLMGVWAVDESLTLSDADQTVYPGKFITTEFHGGQPKIAQVFANQLPSDFERLENRVQRDIQSTLGINDYMVGSGGGSAGTASEAAMLNASAGNRFRLQALIAEERFMNELADMFLSRRQQFLDDEQVFRVLGEQGYEYPRIGPQDIAGRYDFVPIGTQSQPNKEVLRAQFIQQVGVIAGNPIMSGMTNWPELVKYGWTLFDHRFPERFVLTPPERQLTQSQENYIILKGERVAVDPNEPHEEHLQALMEIMDQVLEAAESGDQRVLEAFEDHREQHERFAQGQMAPPGAPPGGPGQAPGNQPGSPNKQVPTLPGLQANVMGGPGGVIA